ncbi:MAG: hypothetical protein WC847_01045 [Candidatus Paceibacterota bacterium]|jgi:hypothetical protein
MNKKILSILVFSLFVFGTTKAFASLTFSSSAITGTTASTIDVGTGNALSLQTTNNGAITTGTGMVTLGGGLTLPMTANSTSGVIFKGATPFIHNFALAGTDGNNTFVGLNAGNFTMTGSTGVQGSSNTAIGVNSLGVNTIGLENVAIGLNALGANTTGSDNVASGNWSLHDNTDGLQNTAIGAVSLRYNTTGSYNVASGDGALYFNLIGSYNTANGYASLLFNTSSYNTALGYQAGYGVSTGSRNTIIGNSTITASKNQVTTGSNNISIGNDVAIATATASNQLDIGNLIYGTALDGTGATLSSGNIGIGVKAPAQKLEVNGGVRLNTVTAKPTCDATVRGTFWSFQGGTGVKDTVEVCAKDVGDAYAWRTIY